MTNSHQTKWLLINVSCLLLIACTNPTGDRAALDKPWGQAGVTSNYDPVRLPSRHDDNLPRAAATTADPNARPATRSEIYRGTGNFVKLGQTSKTPLNTAAPGDITLNFQGSDIAEVVKTVLGDILQLNYSLDERVRGQVYLQTNTPIREDDLLPTLENLLQTHGAALVHSKGLFTVVPASEVPTSALNPRLTPTAERGYQMLILPLRYIGAREMEKILEPVKPRQGAMMVDDRRNMLTLVGSRDELINIRDTVNLFDVDQLRGMSVGLFRLQASSADVIASELQAIFGDEAEGPLAGMVRYLPIERLNALLVITPQERYLTDARVWIERLDRAENPRGLNMYVYHVQNGKADHLATLLNQLFDSQRRNSAGSPLPPATSPTEEGAPLQITTGINAANLDVGEVSVIADTERNALVVMAASADYQKVEQAIKRLDQLPLQVLVEATIVEVSLDDELRYGLQWYFKNRLGGGRSGVGAIGSLPIPSPFDGGLAASASYEVFNASGTRALLTALASDSKVNVISSPTLMVLDNQKALIRVGDQVPIRTSETTNLNSDVGNVTSTIQYRDTGVLLEVTPRVNAGGMVVLELVQEVNDVATTTSSNIQSPTITQRKIDTRVAVQSGETLVLGGLIRENKSQDSQGLPGLRHIPVLGWLFGSSGTNVKRTELVVLITPTAVANPADARAVTREYRRKLQQVAM
ncbi:type II secretion system secretin GspD [Oceanisphaera arctica]|uniref:Type II secretion system protein GspD n=1 Tax=Oceanisphaera arctica TaxID=641510 RepID=A0A2P5TPD7_9GAMM|nr:type II secretion system secretin GspD [Oceanisphaera arctica]PPL17527.1 type II secretion system protein GspD [Oceanisphaera arctica]GHA16526.1 type II secretion system protein GspD [Oceanisphaera arctica]